MKKYLLLIVLVAISSMLTVRSQVIQLDSGLVAYYPFNGNAIDESGNGNNGAIFGATLAEDRFGNENAAFWFDGISTYIKVPDNDLLDIISEISIAGWLNKNSDTAWASMLTKGGEFGDENNYTIHNNENGGIVFTSYNEYGTGGGICNSEIVIPIHEWHFVAFTWDGSFGKIYIDGGLDTASVTELGGEFLPNNSSLYIGVDHPGETEFFHGYLDDIRIYNRWLNEEEILALFNEIPTNLNEQKSLLVYQIEIFPNPFDAKTTIKFNNPNHTKYKLSVFSSSGSTVFEMDNITTDKVEIERGNLNPGIYIIGLQGDKDIHRGKIIIN